MLIIVLCLFQQSNVDADPSNDEDPTNDAASDIYSPRSFTRVWGRVL